MCESTCDTQTSSAANQGDNTVSVAQGGTATHGATKHMGTIFCISENWQTLYAMKL